MTIGRRDFIKVVSAGVVAASTTGKALAEVRNKVPPKAPGILYDGTLCIGCKACEVGCKNFNDMPMDYAEIEADYGVSNIWDGDRDLNGKTLNKIKIYTDGTAAQRNSETDGFAFVKRACMHCLDPDCISACPSAALTKDEVTGIVKYNKDYCTGCRYCQVACPYNIPKFEYEKAIPQIRKCEMCSHVLASGGIPGCCQYCPTGASLFGNFTDIMEEAKRRIALKEGDEYAYPLNKIGGGKVQRRPAAKYIQYIYGEKEGGGTQYLLLSAVPFAKLGLPMLKETSDASRSEGLQHTLYKNLIAPGVLLVGLLFAAHRSLSKMEAGEGGQHE